MDAPSKPAAKAPKDKKWGIMNGGEKTVFVVKVVLMVCSMGFIFGNVLTD
jgi:hypothetical protein